MNRIASFALLFLATLAVGFSIFFPFIPLSNYPTDDASLLLTPLLQAPFHFSSLVSIFTPGNHIDYYPLRDLTYLLDLRWTQANQLEDLTSVRVQQIVWWALGVCGLYGILRQWIESRVVAALASLLFWVHPVHIESVWWISARKDLIALVLGSLALGYGYRSLASQQMAFTLFSMLGKASFALTPAALIVSGRSAWPKRKVLPLVLSAGLILAVWVQKDQYTHWNDMRAHYEEMYRFQSSLAALGRSVTGLFIPSVNAIDVENWGEWLSLNSRYVPIGALAVLAGLALTLRAWTMRARNRKPLFWALCAWLIYLPVSGLIFDHRNFYSVRYFIPIYLCIFLAGIQAISPRINQMKSHRNLTVFLVAGTISLVLVGQSQIRKHWDSNLGAISLALSHSPQSIALNTLKAVEEKNEIRWGRLGASEINEHEARMQWLDEQCENKNRSNTSCLSYWINLKRNDETFGNLITQLNPWNAKRAIATYQIQSSLLAQRQPSTASLKLLLDEYPSLWAPTQQVRLFLVIALAKLESLSRAREQWELYAKRSLLNPRDQSVEMVYVKKLLKQ